MVALTETIQEFEIPAEPFLNLLKAFEQDQLIKKYQTYAQLLEYCINSANPVGHLVLYLCRSYSDLRAQLSDCICTGLQLANFWQDVARDFDLGRVYLPQEDRDRFGYANEDLQNRRYNPAFANLMKFEVDRARELFIMGKPLIEQMPREVQADIELFVRGGLGILQKIEACKYNVWQARPVITGWGKLEMLGKTLPRRIWNFLS
jgi:squalene synthase HpnC